MLANHRQAGPSFFRRVRYYAHTISYKPVIDPDTFGKGGITDHAALKACIREMIVEDGLQLTDETILTISGALKNIEALGNIEECLGRYR